MRAVVLISLPPHPPKQNVLCSLNWAHGSHELIHFGETELIIKQILQLLEAYQGQLELNELVLFALVLQFKEQNQEK